MTSGVRRQFLQIALRLLPIGLMVLLTLNGCAQRWEVARPSDDCAASVDRIPPSWNLSTDGAVHGRIFIKAGYPAAGVMVQLQAIDSASRFIGPPRGSVSDSAGHFMVRLLSAGSYEVRATRIGLQSVRARIQISAEGADTVQLQMAPVVHCHGSLLLSPRRGPEQ